MHRVAIRRFNQGVSPEIRRIDRWKKSGSVKIVDFGGRRNVICLQSKTRAARLRREIDVKLNRDHVFSVEVYSPIGNERWGCGTVTGLTEGWDASNGMWKKLEATVRPGTEVVIEASTEGREVVPGDRCYVDLASIQVK